MILKMWGFFAIMNFSKKLGVFPRLSENKITYVKVFMLEVWKERSIKILIPFGGFLPSLLDFYFPGLLTIRIAGCVCLALCFLPFTMLFFSGRNYFLLLYFRSQHYCMNAKLSPPKMTPFIIGSFFWDQIKAYSVLGWQNLLKTWNEGITQLLVFPLRDRDG